MNVRGILADRDRRRGKAASRRLRPQRSGGGVLPARTNRWRETPAPQADTDSVRVTSKIISPRSHCGSGQADSA